MRNRLFFGLWAPRPSYMALVIRTNRGQIREQNQIAKNFCKTSKIKIFIKNSRWLISQVINNKSQIRPARPCASSVSRGLGWVASSYPPEIFQKIGFTFFSLLSAPQAPVYLLNFPLAVKIFTRPSAHAYLLTYLEP